MKKLGPPAVALKKSGPNGARRESSRRRNARSAIHGRRHPRTELEAAIQRFVDLYDFAPIAYVSFDRAGRIEEANLAATELLNEPRDLLIGRPFAFYVADLDSFLRHLLYCRMSEQKVKTELELKTRKGECIPVQLISTPITSTAKNGALLHQTSIIDLRERKVAEAALRAKQAEIDLILTRTPFMFTRCSRDLRYRYVSDAYAEMLGRKPQEIAGKPIVEMMGEKAFNTIRPYVERALSGRAVIWEAKIPYPSGPRLVHCAYMPEKDDAGEIVGWISSLVDISEQRSAEEKRRESEEHLRALVEQATAGIVRCDLMGRISFVNQRFCEMLGYKETELIDKRIHELTSRADGKKAANLFDRLVKQAKPYQTEKRYVRKDDSTLWASVSASPICEAEGKVKSAVVVIVDITSRKKAEAALQRSKELLKELVQQRTKALHAANVELQNEINRRKGLEGQILEISDREQQRLGTELHDGLCQHLTATAFMTRALAMRLKNHRVIQVEDLEKVAQLINNAATDARNIARGLHRVDVDATSLVKALQDLLDRELWRTPCRLEVKPSFHFEDDEAAAHLYRIAREAVINANKHAQAREVVVKLERSRHGVVLSVTDDGVGLGDKPGGAAGLGFHIMDYRARAAGGHLKVESPKRGGTHVACYITNSK
jgi:PAS domain S-box-containing protein